MSSSSSPPITIDLRSLRSPRYAAVLALVAAWLACGLSIPILGVYSALAGALGSSLLLTVWLRRCGWVGAVPAERLAWHTDGRWVIENVLTGAPMQEFQLCPGARAGAFWAWLVLGTVEGSGARRVFLLTGLDLPAAHLRRLIVRLRLRSAASLRPGRATA